MTESTEERMMRHRTTIMGSWKVILGAGVMAGAMALFAGAPGAKADECQERIIHADHRVHEAVEHHGWDSRQAEHARHELREARAYCWEHSRRWWDVEGNRWHSYRDWDDHDHDRH